MAESTLSIALSDLLLEVAVFLGYSETPADWTTAQAAELDRYVQAGVRQFYYPPGVAGVEAGYNWSFLNPTATVATVADTATSDLPDDLGRVLGDFFYASSEHRSSIVVVSEAQYQTMRAREDSSPASRVACIRHKTQVVGTGQRLEVAWWPVPTGIYTLTYRYEAYNGKLTEANPYPLGGMKHSELLVESCLSIAEQRANDEEGLHTAAFARLLVTGVAKDRNQGARYYGHMGGGEYDGRDSREKSGSVSYKGETW